MIRRVHAEEGVVAIFVALLLPVLLALAGFGLGALVLTGGERELQRSVDAAALAAASSLPLSDLTATNRAQATALACTVVDDNLDAATIAQGFGHTDPAACDNDGVSVTYESELADVVGLQDDVTGLQDLLSGAITATEEAVEEVCEEITTLELIGGLLQPVTTLVCETVTTVVDTPLDVPVDLSDVAPALLTPRVRVSASHVIDSPLGELVGTGLGSSEVAAEAVARRRLKNAVLLPVEDCPGLEARLISGGASASLLGHEVRMGELRLAVEAHCELADPSTYADIAGGIGFGALDAVASRLAELVPGHGEVPACLLGGLRQDLEDVYDPPAGGPAPAAGDVLQSATLADEDVIVIVTGVVGSLNIPVFDMFAVPAADVQSGNLDNVRDWPTAWCVFRASLIEEGSEPRALGCLGL